MRSELPLLASLEIAAPCPMSWAIMDGDSTRRYCGSCKLHVHDLSAMTAGEAEILLQTHQGELCVRYTQDSDGQIVTDAFPSRLRPLRALVLKHCAMAAAFVLLALTAGVHQASADTTPAKAKPAPAKKTGKKQEPVRTLGKPAMRPATNPAPNAGLTTKMGEPVRVTPVETPKNKALDLEAPRFMGRVVLPADLQNGQVLPTLTDKVKEAPKSPERPKP